jgi:hypothetical protein
MDLSTAIAEAISNPIRHANLLYPALLFPHSHSIIRIVPNELICLCKQFLRLENSPRPNRQMRMAFEFKEEFDRSRKTPLSATINIDRSTFLESTGNAAPPT